MAQQSEKHNTAAGEEKKKRCFIKSQCSENVCHLSRPLQSERKSDTEGEVFLSKKKKRADLCRTARATRKKKKRRDTPSLCLRNQKQFDIRERRTSSNLHTQAQRERESSVQARHIRQFVAPHPKRKKDREKKKTSRRVKRRRLRKLHHFPAQGVSSFPYGIRHSL